MEVTQYAGTAQRSQAAAWCLTQLERRQLTLTLFDPCHSAANIWTLSSCFGEIVTCGRACFAPLLSSRAVTFPAGGIPDISAIVLSVLRFAEAEAGEHNTKAKFCFRIRRLTQHLGRPLGGRCLIPWVAAALLRKSLCFVKKVTTAASTQLIGCS